MTGWRVLLTAIGQRWAWCRLGLLTYRVLLAFVITALWVNAKNWLGAQCHQWAYLLETDGAAYRHHQRNTRYWLSERGQQVLREVQEGKRL